MLAFILGKADQDAHWRASLDRDESNRESRHWLWLDSGAQKAYGWLDHRVFELDLRNGRRIKLAKN